MQQQLIQSTIQILPATMEDILTKIQALLSSNSLLQDGLLPNIVKSLFFGLWNFDKMINQHNLSTRISDLLLKIPKKNAINFFRQMLSHLHEKWNLIDHHRINKFMQLVRYLISQAFKLAQKLKFPKSKIDAILLEIVFNEATLQNGLAYHIIDIYFSICQQTLPQGATLQGLSIFEELLTKNPNQHLRLYIASHVYEKYKAKLVSKMTSVEELGQKIQHFANHFLEMAKREEKENHRKNMYAIVGYAKSQEVSFSHYSSQKREKALAEQEKKKKKITKSKKVEIKKLKQKRKEKKKLTNKNQKIMSVRKFGNKSRQQKGIEEQ